MWYFIGQMVFNLFKKKKTGAEPAMNAHYYQLRVREVIQETDDAISIVFDEPANEIEYTSGQFLTLIPVINSEKVRRAYSLCTSPFVDKFPAVTVKRIQNGLVSNYLNDHIKVGDEIEVMEPRGNFTTVYDENNKRHIVMFGGGSGITPLMSIAKSTLHAEPESIVSLIYCNRNINSVIFKQHLEELQDKFEGRMHVIHVLDDAPVNWQGPSGLLNHEMLKRLIERIPDWGIENTTYLMCGPEGMMKNVQSMLEEMQIPRDKIFRESFVAPIIDKEPKPTDEAPVSEVQSRKVTVIYEGEEHTFAVEPDKTILETALDLGIDLPFSCQSGLCTACRGRRVSGEVKMDEMEGLSDSEIEQGYVLTCVGHPATDDVVIEIG